MKITEAQRRERAAMTWSDVFWKFRRKGHEHSSAAYEADRWEARQRNRANVSVMRPMPENMPRTPENIIMWTLGEFHSAYGFHDCGDYTECARLIAAALRLPEEGR